MKTVSFNKSRRSWISFLGTLGALGGWYLYRRRGGGIRQLGNTVGRTVRNVQSRARNDSAESSREYLRQSPRDQETQYAGVKGRVESRPSEISTTPENMDRFIST